MIQIQITDDFDLKKIADSGQCFRVKEFENGLFRFLTKDHVLYIRKVSDSFTYEVSCSMEEWQEIWHDYFDLATDYSSIRKKIPKKDRFLAKAAAYSEGIRILKQDPWEMLLTFILSQRKSIPAIKKNVEELSRIYGHPIKTEPETLFTFPTVADFLAGDMDALADCSLGYRLPYIRSAISLVGSGSLSLDALSKLKTPELLDTLKTVHGVGDKVANCICLFAYSRHETAPVDTWILKAMEKYYDGKNPFPKYGNQAGIMQQFMFYYMQTGGEMS